jgi:uncharacterized membrane protein YqiK
VRNISPGPAEAEARASRRRASSSDSGGGGSYFGDDGWDGRPRMHQPAKRIPRVMQMVLQTREDPELMRQLEARIGAPHLARACASALVCPAHERWRATATDEYNRERALKRTRERAVHDFARNNADAALRQTPAARQQLVARTAAVWARVCAAHVARAERQDGGEALPGASAQTAARRGARVRHA